MAVFDWLADIFGFTAPSVIEIIFVCCAVFGSLFFIVMMMLMLVGDVLGGSSILHLTQTSAWTMYLRLNYSACKVLLLQL